MAAAGSIVPLGVVLEQHPDRARLYAQWRGLQWRVFADPLDLVDLDVVPVPLAIDEHGVVRGRLKTPSELTAFVTTQFPAPENATPQPSDREEIALERDARSSGSAVAWRRLGDARFLSGGDAEAAYAAAVAADPNDARSHFRLGVSRLQSMERGAAPPTRAQAAIDAMTRALELTPTQYIWRRRLQQYGPRLDKPYDFYSWVAAARQELVARGETPEPLTVEPSGTEISGALRSADPINGLDRLWTAGTSPADTAGFVVLTPLVVPARVRPGGRVRVRLRCELAALHGAHWNDEGPGLRCALEPASTFRLLDSQLEDRPTTPQQLQRIRHLECELGVPPDAAPGHLLAKLRVVYEICEASGICRSLRQDVDVVVDVDPKTEPLGPAHPGRR